MPTHKSAEKRMVTSKKDAARNRQTKSKLHSATKKLESVKTKEELQVELKNAYSIIDKAAKKKVIHKKKAANLKSKLTKKMQAATK